MCTLVEIPVDVDHLWKTPVPFKIYSTHALQGVGPTVGEFHQGFIIKMKVDPRDVANNFRFSAHILNSTTIVVNAPALDYHDVGNDIEAERAATLLKPDERLDNIVITEAFTHGYLDFLGRRFVNQMQYHLKFSASVNLNSSVLLVHHGQRESRLLLEASNFCVDADCLGAPDFMRDEDGNPVADTAGNTHVYHKQIFAGSLLWRVADISKGTRKQSVGPDANEPTDVFTAMFGNMHMGA